MQPIVMQFSAWCDHASHLYRWYPGCYFLINEKGLNYITAARSTMSAEVKELAAAIEYNSVDLKLLGKSSKFGHTI